jgi:NADH pyrophosphatase NudC (nudix superfamily)
VYLEEGEKKNTMAKIVERTRARYEVRQVDFGKVYRWRPGSVVVECERGKRLSLTASKDAYCSECGANHSATVEEALGACDEEEDEHEVYHPWHSSRPYYAPMREI